MIGDGDREAPPRAVARHGHIDCAAALHRLGGVAIDIGERPSQRLIVANDRASSVVRRESDVDIRGNACAPQLFQQLDEVYLALRPFGEPTELGELAGETFEPVGFRIEDLHGRCRPAVRRSDRPTHLVNRNPHRRERVLDFVRHPPRHFAERAQTLRLELAVAGGLERSGELAQRLAQRLELRCPAARRRARQRLVATDELRPSDQLVDGT